jgi:hypothetical protein
MADTSGIPDVVGKTVNGGYMGARSRAVSPWIKPSTFPAPLAQSAMAIATPTMVPATSPPPNGSPARDGQNTLHRSNGVGMSGERASQPVELSPIEMLRKPSSSRAQHPSATTSRNSATTLRLQPSGRPRQSTTRPVSASRNVQSFCEWCRQPLGPRNHSGRKRVYCSQSCRQRAYQSRKRSKQLNLREGELVVSSVLVARMNRRLKALEKALAEVEEAELHANDQRIAELCQAARRLRRLVVGPPTR